MAPRSGTVKMAPMYHHLAGQLLLPLLERKDHAYTKETEVIHGRGRNARVDDRNNTEVLDK